MYLPWKTVSAIFLRLDANVWSGAESLPFETFLGQARDAGLGGAMTEIPRHTIPVTQALEQYNSLNLNMYLPSEVTNTLRELF